MENEKIIFLDIDGVLTSWRSYYGLQDNGEGGIWEEFDPLGVAMLLKIIDKYNYKIVISSKWRLSAKNILMRQLKKHNLYEHLHLNRYTPAKFSSTRGQEIDLWLREHPNVKSFIILDDNSDMMSYQLKWFIQTDSNDGILTEHYLKMIEVAECQKK